MSNSTNFLNITQNPVDGLHDATLSVNGTIFTYNDNHPNYSTLNEYLTTTPIENWDENTIEGYIRPKIQAGQRLSALSERATTDNNGNIFFDGDPIEGTIARHIARLFREGDEQGWKALVNFLEKIQTNPSERARTELYEWLQDRDFTILPDGDFIAYKGVMTENDNLVSIHSGEAYVNNILHTGRIPNNPGNTITMERSKVNPDQYVGCSYGLHAGTWEYASNFVASRATSKVLTVSINPRDVVSVPQDCNSQKLRVSRYVTLNAVTNPLSTTTHNNDENDDFDYCENCGDNIAFNYYDTLCDDCEDEEYDD